MFHSGLQMYFNRSGKLYLLWNGSFHPKLIHLLYQSQRLHGVILCGLANRGPVVQLLLILEVFMGTCLSQSHKAIIV